MATPEKIHVGLISADKSWEGLLKEGLAQIGGGYVHAAPTMIELYQKMTMQKVQLIVLVSPAGETGAEAQAVVSFFRGKKDFAQTPICVLVDAPVVQMSRLLKDSRVRGFSAAGGAFLALMTMKPLIEKTATAEFVEPISLPWIQSEFLESLRAKIGQATEFRVEPASDDDLHTGFFCQYADEVRSHLGWFKFAARLQEGTAEGMKTLFQGMSSEMTEQMAEALLKSIVDEFKSKAEADLASRGAIFYPPIEQLQPAERKLVYGGSKASGLVFKSVACNLVLEVIQYI